MLTLAELVTLERSLRDTRVLTVYLDGTASDPAARHAWQTQLAEALDGIRSWIADSPPAERHELDACVRLLDAELARLGPGVGAKGWAAFIASDSVRHAETLPTPMPTLAAWSTGACVAPYIRALEENRPVFVAILDAHGATIHRYRFGVTEQVDTVRAHHAIEPPTHMGDAPRQGFHTGTRGSTGRDAAQRARLAGMHRMLDEVAERVTTLAGADGWVLLGGIPRVVAQAEERLDALAPRVLALGSLDVHATPAQITAAARAGASALRDAWDARQLDEITADADAGALGVVGSLETERALELSCVRALYVSANHLAAHGAQTEDAVRRALDQDATVEVVSHGAMARLDARGGMAARLRFRPSVAAADVLANAPTQTAELPTPERQK